MKPPKLPEPHIQTSEEMHGDLGTARFFAFNYERLEREKEAVRKLDPRDLANPPHKPPKFDIKF